MRTYKQNIIELEHDESITIRCGDAEVTIVAFSKDDRNALEVKEVGGLLSFITLRGHDIVEGFTDEQVKYLQSIGVNHRDA